VLDTGHHSYCSGDLSFMRKHHARIPYCISKRRSRIARRVAAKHSLRRGGGQGMFVEPSRARSISLPSAICCANRLQGFGIVGQDMFPAPFESLAHRRRTRAYCAKWVGMNRQIHFGDECPNAAEVETP
jgi:hypothetical protein